MRSMLQRFDCLSSVLSTRVSPVKTAEPIVGCWALGGTNIGDMLCVSVQQQCHVVCFNLALPNNCGGRSIHCRDRNGYNNQGHQEFPFWTSKIPRLAYKCPKIPVIKVVLKYSNVLIILTCRPMRMIGLHYNGHTAYIHRSVGWRPKKPCIRC